MHPQMAHLGANAAWHMGHWDEMATYVSSIESEEGPELSTGSFLSAVLNVRHGNYTAARGLRPALIIHWWYAPERLQKQGRRVSGLTSMCTCSVH